MPPQQNKPPIYPVVIPDPTQDQRYKIRQMLDKSFDDSIGCYLDGLSDQAIAQTLDLPRMMVERLREAAYGPLREHPDLTEIRRESAEVKLKADQHRLAGDQMTAEAHALLVRLDEHRHTGDLLLSRLDMLLGRLGKIPGNAING